MIWPDSVCRLSDSSRLARPKSVILGVPSLLNSTLLGFKSRWMIPASWASLDGPGERGHQLGRSPAWLGIAGQAVFQGSPLEQLEREEGKAIDLADLVDLDDIRVAEPGDGLGLDPNAGEVVGPRPLSTPDHLEGDQAVQAPLPGLVDHAHAS